MLFGMPMPPYLRYPLPDGRHRLVFLPMANTPPRWQLHSQAGGPRPHPGDPAQVPRDNRRNLGRAP